MRISSKFSRPFVTFVASDNVNPTLKHWAILVGASGTNPHIRDEVDSSCTDSHQHRANEIIVGLRSVARIWD